MSVQRNTLVPPFSVRDKLTQKDGALQFTHQKYFSTLEQAVNSSGQVTATIPASSADTGEAGTFAFDSNWLYVCVGKNEWRRASLNTF